MNDTAYTRDDGGFLKSFADFAIKRTDLNPLVQKAAENLVTQSGFSGDTVNKALIGTNGIRAGATTYSTCGTQGKDDANKELAKYISSDGRCHNKDPFLGSFANPEVVSIKTGMIGGSIGSTDSAITD